MNQLQKIEAVLKTCIPADVTACEEALAIVREMMECEPVAWIYDWYADDGCGISEAVTDWVTRNYEEAHSPTNGCHNIRPLVPASALAAEQVKLRELVEVLRMVQECAIDMRGDDFNLTTEQWTKFHAAIAKHGGQM